MTDAAAVFATAYECFEITLNDRVAEIVLKRPEAHNSMIRAFWRELPEIVRAIDAKAQARVILLRSSGKHFSSGMDLSVFVEGGAAPGDDDARTRAVAREAFRHKVKALQDTFSCLAEARIPVVAAIQGGCIGGAVDLISACDLRFMSSEAYLVIQEINIGMTADVGTFPRLQRLLPEGVVRELAFTGRRMGAEEALRFGLANGIGADHDATLALARAAAKAIAERSPIAIAGVKAVMNYAIDHSNAETLDFIALWQAGMFSPADIAEAFAARSAGRVGDFPDLAPLPGGL